ncbi:MAG TPA: hypothetical protein VF845_03090, partial [Terriglobales bacterium]
MLLLILILPIVVTFSTPTPDNVNNRQTEMDRHTGNEWRRPGNSPAEDAKDGHRHLPGAPTSLPSPDSRIPAAC